MMALGIVTLIVAVILIFLAIFSVSAVCDVSYSMAPLFIMGIPFLLVDVWLFVLAVYFFVKC